MQHELITYEKIYIRRSEAKNVLPDLCRDAYEQIENPPLKKKIATVLAWVFGGLAVWVYYGETLEFTRDKSVYYAHFAVAASMIGNIAVNGFYNNDAVQELFLLRDSQTGKVIVPGVDLGVTFVISGLSSFAFAFLVLEDNFVSFLNFFLQVVTYTAQHYFSVMTIFKLFREEKSKRRHPNSHKAKSKITKKIEGLTAKIIADFCQNRYEEIKSLYIFDEELFKVNIDTLSDRIISECISDSEEETKCDCVGNLKTLLFWSIQSVGVLSQVIGNIGYCNSTLNGWESLSNRTTSIVMTSLTMPPLLWLSCYVSYQLINSITNFLKEIISQECGEIGRKLPYAVRKSPLFSIFFGVGLSVMAIFSFYTSLELLMDAVYDKHPEENPAWFGWLDRNDSYQTVLVEATRISVIIFNLFPVIEVQGFLSQLFCYLKGTDDERKILKLIWGMGSLARRVSLIPATNFELGFEGGHRATRHYNGQHERTQRTKNPCDKVSECFRWLFNKFTCFKEPDSTSINDDNYYALNVNGSS